MNKETFLQNICFNIPRIFYFFQPCFSVQLLARFAVKQLSGETDVNKINKILESNPSIYRYLLDFYKICTKVYKGALIEKSFTYNHILYKQILGSFIEVKNLLCNECDQTLRISENQLKLWGADIRLLSPKENNQEGIKLNNKDSFKRD